jgi:ribosomal protein L24E
MRRCWLCKHDVADGDYVIVVLADGRLVDLCGVCLDKADRDEPYCEHLDYTEDVA